MAPDVAPAIERLLDHYVPVRASQIEAEFDRIWDEAADGTYDTSSVRLRLSSLVAWGADSDAGERFEQVMETLAKRHPCRGILAMSLPGVAGLESSISAHCWRTAAGGRHACAEEILLRAGPAQEQELASAVLALLVAEVPAVVWLLDDPAATRLPEEIADAADRVFVDSARASTSPTDLRTLVRAAEKDDIDITDLAWVRTRAWRELVAQLFDGNEAQLDDVRDIEIVGGGAALSAAALLSAGWLASRLSLTAASASAAPDAISATFYDGTRGVAMRVSPSGRTLELESILIRTSTAEFVVELHGENNHLHVRAEAMTPPLHRVVAREPTDDASVLLAALEGPRDERAYRESVKAVLELFEV